MTETESAYHSELVDGQEITKPVPRLRHARVQSYLIRTLGQQLDGRASWEVLSEMNLLCGNDRLVPNIVVAGPGAQYRDDDLISPAALAVEIMSPGQTIGNLFDRADRIVKAGTPLCIVVWPERQRVWAYTKDDVAEESKRVNTGIEGCEVDLLKMWESTVGPPDLQ